MAKIADEGSKKISSISGVGKFGVNKRKWNSISRSAAKKNNRIRNIFHPDYILFDWEFFSRELEFE